MRARPGAGRWFRDGFTIDVQPALDAPPALPMAIAVTFTADPKELELAKTLHGHAAGVVDSDGTVRVGRLVYE
jgi:hypothetical protein